MKAVVAEVEPLLDQVYALPLYSQADLVSVAENERGWSIKGGNPGRFDCMREPVPCWSLFTDHRVISEQNPCNVGAIHTGHTVHSFQF